MVAYNVPVAAARAVYSHLCFPLFFETNNLLIIQSGNIKGMKAATCYGAFLIKCLSIHISISRNFFLPALISITKSYLS